VGPRTVLNAVVKRKFISPHRESNPRTPILKKKCTDILKAAQLRFIRHLLCITGIYVDVCIYVNQKRGRGIKVFQIISETEKCRMKRNGKESRN
jgi:hypothetical protein